MGEEYKKLAELSQVEKTGKVAMVDAIKSLLAYVDKPIVILPETLGDEFGDVEDASVVNTGVVIIRTRDGTVVSRPLDKFATKDFLRLVQGFLSELLRFVTAKADEAAALPEKPQLRVRATLEGGRMLIFDWRSFHIHVKNDGGEARTLRVRANVVASDSDNEGVEYGPFSVARGSEVQFDLEKFQGVGSGALKLEIDCDDVSYRSYSGQVTMSVESEEWDAVNLARHQPDGDTVVQTLRTQQLSKVSRPSSPRPPAIKPATRRTTTA